jgi:hypothetical protein
MRDSFNQLVETISITAVTVHQYSKICSSGFDMKDLVSNLFFDMNQSMKQGRQMLVADTKDIYNTQLNTIDQFRIRGQKM